MFLPDAHVNSIYDIELEQLKERGIKGIIADLDNTLVGAKEPLANPKLESWFKSVKQLGIQVVIVSNNNESRVSTFAKPLSIPFIFAAKKPQNRAFRKALNLMNLSPEETAVVGDQLMTDVLGGNRSGLHTVWVKPVSAADDGFFTRMNRRMERWVLLRMKKKGWLTWENQNERQRS